MEATLDTTMETVKVTIPVKTQVITNVEVELPFIGRIPETDRFIRISSDKDIHTITHWKHFGDCWEHSRWNFLDSVNIGEYVPCTQQEWDHAVEQTMQYLETLIITTKTSKP